ncbi:MAG: putative lipid II flippase FtsW [Clostridia bacterium]|jgi:cell division protein FtsW|nr:putative lipid II flippase FtsW [Clostridia bacterium]MBT7123390.1 putative lipid II flippase FtsW [Clostridia bacterium]
MRRHSFDYMLLVLTMILVLFGIIMVFSASFYYAENSANTDYDGYFYFWRQVSGAGIGLAIMIALIFFDYNKLKKLRFWLLGIGFVLMILVFIPGVGQEINGSKRWLDLRFMTMQPVEVLKISVIVFMAAGISINKDKMKQFKYGILPYAILLFLCAVLLILQPNFSAIVTLAALIFIMILVGGASIWQFGIVGIAGLGAGYIAMIATDYRMSRIFAYLDPWKYAAKESYQLVQSLYSIGSGGIFGRGLGNSRQKFLYLPYGESDFIFAIIVEELGYVGGIVLIAAFGLLIWRGVRIAIRASSAFGTMLATGITALIAIQVFINIGVVVGLVPPTGVALPFISAGRTSLIIFMASIGILLNISRQSKDDGKRDNSERKLKLMKKSQGRSSN